MLLPVSNSTEPLDAVEQTGYAPIIAASLTDVKTTTFLETKDRSTKKGDILTFGDANIVVYNK
jgi:hypothetical protein